MRLKEKASLLILIIAIITIVVGVYASKIQRGDTIVYTRTITNTTLCYGTVNFATTKNSGFGVIKITYATLVYGAFCPLIKTIYLVD